LARKHLGRFWWTDPCRILYELVADTRELDIEAIVDDLLRIDDETLEGGLKGLLENHLTLGYYMKGIAERFGAIRRGLTVGEGDLRSLEIRFANTPIYDEAVREALLLHADFDRVREIVHKIRGGEIEVVVHRSEETPTPLAYPILRRYVEAPELFSPEAEREEVLDRMRLHLSSEPVHLLCFECGHFHEEVRIGQMLDHPECANCKSRLLTVLGRSRSCTEGPSAAFGKDWHRSGMSSGLTEGSGSVLGSEACISPGRTGFLIPVRKNVFFDVTTSGQVTAHANRFLKQGISGMFFYATS